MRKLLAGVALLAVALLGVTPLSHAHKVNLFGYAEGGFIRVEGYFSDGAPTVESKIEGFDPKGELVAQGVTDGDGRFFFPAEATGTYRVAMDSSMGHVAEITVEVGAKAAPTNDGAGDSLAAGESTGSPASGVPQLAALEEKVERLSAEVVALRKQLEKPGLTQIVGGLGFIIGLAGAYLWGAAKKKGQ
jgi:nickel transport protein